MGRCRYPPYYPSIHGHTWTDLSANDATRIFSTFCAIRTFDFFVEETNDYAYYLRQEMRKKKVRTFGVALL